MKLHVEKLSVVFRKSPLNQSIGLSPISFSINSGAPLVLNGPNGCGKTTLLKTLAGLRRPSAGTIMCRDIRATSRNGLNWLRSHSTLVQQDPSAGLFLDLTLAENLGICLPNSGIFSPYVTGSAFRDAEDAVSNLVEFYADRATCRLGELSGGQQQLFAIACAGVARQPLLLFDEPTSALDATAGEKVDALLQSVCNAPDTFVLIVSHDQGLASRLGFMSQNFVDLLDS